MWKSWAGHAAEGQHLWPRLSAPFSRVRGLPMLARVVHLPTDSWRTLSDLLDANLCHHPVAPAFLTSNQSFGERVHELLRSQILIRGQAPAGEYIYISESARLRTPRRGMWGRSFVWGTIYLFILKARIPSTNIQFL